MKQRKKGALGFELPNYKEAKAQALKDITKSGMFEENYVSREAKNLRKMTALRNIVVYV